MCALGLQKLNAVCRPQFLSLLQGTLPSMLSGVNECKGAGSVALLIRSPLVFTEPVRSETGPHEAGRIYFRLH